MRVGFKVSLLLLSLAISFSSLSHAQNLSSNELKNDQERGRKWSGQWAFQMGGTSRNEGKDQGAAAYVWFDTHFKYEFAKWLKAEVDPRLSFYSSRLQERFDDNTYENRIWMSDAHLSLIPVDFVEVRAGALNQGFTGSSILVSHYRSFPGVQERLKFKFGEIEAQAIVQQAVPTSHTLNTERESEEKLPSFNTQMIALKGKHLNMLEWNANGGLFQWANLPSKVAWESRMAGNMGSGVEIPDSAFDFDHQGWFANGEVCYCSVDALGFAFEYQRIQNTKAPSYAADAQLWGLGPNIKFGDRELKLRYFNYFIESDATVAVYSRSKTGNTNRNGDALEASLHFKDQGFTVFAEGYRARPINRSEAQRDLSIFFVGVESDYASF